MRPSELFVVLAQVVASRDEDSVASPVLGQVQRLVGGSKQAGTIVGMNTIGRDATADAQDSEWLTLAKWEGVRGDRGAYLFRNHESFRIAGVRKDDQELLAAEATEDVVIPHFAAHELC